MGDVQTMVDHAFVEEIRRLERENALLQASLGEARKLNLGDSVRWLRSMEVVLLYVGSSGTEDLERRLRAHMGNDWTNEATQDLLDLNHAPVSARVREEMREAFDHGARRW